MVYFQQSSLVIIILLSMSKHRDQEEVSEDQSEQQNQQQKSEVRKPKIEKIDKFKSFKKIVINISMTQYPVVSEVSEDLNWKIQRSNEAGDWDVYWTDLAIDPDILIKMHLFQKINHYPGMHVIARKNLLGMNLMALRNKFPEQYNFFPLTWMLPMQYSQFRAYYQTKPKGKARTFIAKPEAQCQGRGIFLTRKIQDLQNGKHYVVQRYIARPFLLQGLKFDLRIYVLLCGTNPMRLYMYKQGLARLATEPYSQPNAFNLEKQYVHLTNYAINKNNPKFIFNNNSNNMGIGHKRSITCVFKQLGAKGLNIEELKQKINDVAIKTLICGLPHMSHQYKCSQPQDYSGNMCFHILGLDIMLNSKGEPVLLEVNHTPSFTTDTPLDHKIKYNLIKDTLVLMNINTKSKNELYSRAKQINKERLLSGKRQIYQGEERQKAISQAQAIREEYEDKHLGGFQRIFPIKNEQKMKKYNQIIQTANKMYFQENGSFRLKQFEQKKISKLQYRAIQPKITAQNKKSKQHLNPEKKGIQFNESTIIINELDRSLEQKASIEQMQGLVRSQNNIQDKKILLNNSQYISPSPTKQLSEKKAGVKGATQASKEQALEILNIGNSMRRSNSIKIGVKKELPYRIQNSQIISRYKERMKSITVGQRYNKTANIPTKQRNFPNLPEEVVSINLNISTQKQIFKRTDLHAAKRIYSQNKNRGTKIYECLPKESPSAIDKKASGKGNFVIPKIVNINLDNEVRYMDPPNSFQPFKKANNHANQ